MKYDYDDINLLPKLGIVDSRSECDTSIIFGKNKFKLPIIPANMQAVIDEALAFKLAQNGYFYIMHRFDIDIIKFVSEMKKANLIISISIGVNQDSYLLINELVNLNLIPDYITIDVAHGHCLKMERIIKFLKSKLNSYIIAGNICTPDAVNDLKNWGADCVKIGIGPGCFIPNTEISTHSGIKKIKDIEVGDMVLTHKNRYEKVLATTSYLEEDDLIQINDNISTKTHKYYVIDIFNKNDVTIDNYQDYGYWIEAIKLDKQKHFLLELTEE